MHSEPGAARTAACKLSPVCDGRPRELCPGGVGFETSTARGETVAGLVSNATRPGMTVPQSDENWQTEWSGGLGERSGARSRSRGVLGASQSAGHPIKNFSWPEVWLGGGWILTRRASTQAE